MIPPSHEIKRQILMQSDQSGVKKRLLEAVENQSMTDGEVIEIANALEQMTKTKGWIHTEAYVIRMMDIPGLIQGEQDDGVKKGVARGYVDLLQWIDQTIKARDHILEKNKRSDEGQDESPDR